MRIISKVHRIEVKRCFVVSQFVKMQKGKRRYQGLLSKKEFEDKLQIAMKRVLRLSEKQLDKIIADEYQKRLNAYDQSEWYICEVSPAEVGVWQGAGGLPLNWTDCSLKETAQIVKHALKSKSDLIKKRAKRAIPNMLETNVGELQNYMYLFPILLEGGTGTNGRRKLTKRTKFDIDDGCMRSITLTIAGAKTINVFLGFQEESNQVG